MKIIIVGLGQTGNVLLSSLAGENIDIVVIDRNRTLVNEATDKYNANGIVGSGASRETLLQAGADTADVIVALTPVDEVNLLSCMQAKALGTRYAAARLLMPDFVGEEDNLKKEYNIDFFMKPRYDIAEEIYRNIGMPGFSKIEGFWGNKVHIINLNILDNSILKGKSLTDIRQKLNIDILTITVLRKGKLHIPKGDFIIESGDSINVAVSNEKLDETLEKLGIKRKRSKKIVIVGGSNTCKYLLKMLEKDRCDITIMESDPAKCKTLMKEYPNVNIEYVGVGTMDLLTEESVASADALISLTGNDETNLVIAMFAWSCHIPSVITRVDKPEHVKLLYKVNIDITVSPAESSAMHALRFLRELEVKDAGKDIGNYYLLADSKAEIIEVPATDDFRALGKKLRDTSFRRKKDVLITAIIRGDELIIPTGETSIATGDSVIISSTRKNAIRSLNDILS